MSTLFAGPAGMALTSGAGHVYYALIVGTVFAILILFGAVGTRWVIIPIIAMAGVFADTYAHGYTH